LILAAATLPLGSQTAQPVPQRPKLVLAIMVDQFRYDYLTRFESEFNAGLKRLLTEGAVFTNANYDSAPTVTAVGHGTFLTGATPAVSGIVGNDWWDRAAGKRVLSITDETVTTLGGNGAGASPRRLMVSTVGDELKISGHGGKVIGVSLKDRSAILPAGHMADGAFWYDSRSGNFVSSTYYFKALPAWAEDVNQSRTADKYAGRQWRNQKMPAQPGPQLYSAITSTAFGDEIVLDFALRALASEKLGAGEKTDLLAVSFSSVDYVGHGSGPDSPDVHEMILAVDKVVGQLLDAAEKQAGAGNVVAVFSADHGVAAVPEENIARKMPGGRTDSRAERTAVEQALVARFGPGNYISYFSESAIYLAPDPVPGKRLDRAEMQNVVASAMRAQPHVMRVYTRAQFENGSASSDVIDRRIRNGFHYDRSADIMIVHEPNWQAGGSTANHGSPFSYDTHVPVIFLGQGRVRPGQYHDAVAIQDIGPTLAQMLGVAAPSGSVGRVLGEMLP
jgi:hypothetical protein